MAESSGRSIVTFVVGLVLGIGGGLVGGVGFGAMFGGDEDVECPAAVVPECPPPTTAAAPEPAPVPEEPAPAPEAPVAAPKAPPPPAASAVAPKAPPKAAARAPEPPAPPPAERVEKPTATITSSGPTEVVFIGGDGARYTPDAVPPGTYAVHANWGDGLVKSGEITVKEGKAVKLLCDPPTRTCKAK